MNTAETPVSGAALHAGILLLIGFLIGLFAFFVAAGFVSGYDARELVGAHIQGLLNGFIVILFAYLTEFATLSEQWKVRAVNFIILQGYLNVLGEFLQPFWNVRGIQFALELGWKNNFVNLLFLTVTILCLVASSVLVYGLVARRRLAQG